MLLFRANQPADAAMRAYDWPGNVRELRNRLVRALSFAKSRKIGVDDIFPGAPAEETPESSSATLDEARVEAERHRIRQALALNHGRVGQTARSLGISRVTLWTKMKRLRLSYKESSTEKTNVRDDSGHR